MGDYLFYVTSSGRVAKRDFKSPKELERMIAALPDGEEDTELEDQLAAAEARAARGTRQVARGVRAARSFVSFIREKTALVGDILSDAPDGTTERHFARQDKERELKAFWLAEQDDLRERFRVQEAGDKAKEAEKSRLRIAAEKIARDAATAAVRAGWKAAVKKKKKKGSES